MKIEINKVYNCDCRILMEEMMRQNIKADWLITDPPYGIGEDGGKNAKRGSKKVLATEYVSKNWDKERITRDYFDLMFKASKNQIIFGGNYYSDILPPTKNWIVWDKRCSEKQKNDFSDFEMAWASTGGARMFRYLYNGMLQGDMQNKDKRIHPTQKPTQLWYMLLNYYTKPNDLILDPFMGSFTTAETCLKSGRAFLGAELDEDYFKAGSDRINALKAQISMFKEI